MTYVRVVLNGRDLGLHLAIEGMNKRFLKRHFSKATGNLYEGYLRDVDGRLDQDGGVRTNQTDVRALFTAAMTEEPGQRFAQLSRVLEVDRFASFAAMEVPRFAASSFSANVQCRTMTLNATAGSWFST